MKAQHVVTGRDRDKSYQAIVWCIVLVILGIVIAANGYGWPGIILIALGALCGIGARARLRGEI